MYLIVRCSDLSDQYECDADRMPLCVVEDYLPYFKQGYEIYAINADGSLTLEKDHYVAGEEGMCVVRWTMDADVILGIEKFKGMTRDDVTADFIKGVKKKYGFTGSVKNIRRLISCSGSYGDEINGEWVVFGEYADDDYPMGY